MNDAIEKLNALRKKKADQIISWRSEIDQLETAMRDMQGVIDGIDEAIKELSGVAVSNPKTPALIGKYAKMGLTPAILDVLEVAGSAPGLFALEIIDRLESEGFKSHVKNLYASVYTVALKLVKDGRAREGKKDGKRTFMKKQAA
jgi:hypothetical protein